MLSDDGSDALQFDQAEPAGDAVSGDMTCSVCAQPIADSYYEVNGHVTCQRCRRDVEAHFKAGSSASQFVRAAALGLLAAGAGFGIYYAIAKLTGMEFSLIAIVVGVMVGAAVKRGTNGRGGRRYQLLAVFLTYAAIVSSYVPFALEGIREAVQAPPANVSADTLAARPAAGETSPARAEADTSALTAGQAAIGLVVLAGLILALPFLAGFENILGLLIIGIGLYAAWNAAGRPALNITGPYRVRAAPAS